MLKKVSVAGTSSNVNYTYNTAHDLTKIKTGNNVEYNFTYDKFKNPSTVSVGTVQLTQNTYESPNGNLTRSTYGNGTNVSYTYDNLDRLASMWYGTTAYKWQYDSNNLLKQNNQTTTILLSRKLHEIRDKYIFTVTYL